MAGLFKQCATSRQVRNLGRGLGRRRGIGTTWSYATGGVCVQKQRYRCRRGPEIDDLGANPILCVRPPPVDKSERSLPRRQRCVLMQLRSGYSFLLHTYSHRIGASADAVCPECRIRRHLFECEVWPTPLSVEDLWWVRAHFVEIAAHNLHPVREHGLSFP